MKRAVMVNGIVSAVIFVLMFYAYAGKSGGDIAILASTILLGLVHIAVAAVYNSIAKKRNVSAILLVIITMLALEITVLQVVGLEINNWLRQYK